MNTGNLGKAAGTVALVAIGVIVAGYLMSTLRGSVGLIATAHSGYDS